MKKEILKWTTILMVAIVSVCFVSCGDDDDDDKWSGGTQSEIENGKADSGKIDTEVLVIEDNDILMGVNVTENGWFSYVLQFGFGASSDDAYRKGMTQMKLTVWADNGCMDTPYTTSNYGKKKTHTLYLSPTNREWYDWIYVQSKDTKVTFNYKLEYYNSKNGQWYDIQSRKLTFYK